MSWKIAQSSLSSHEKMEIVVVGPPSPTRDSLLKDEAIWGRSSVIIKHVATPEELRGEISFGKEPDLVVIDCSSSDIKWDSFKEPLQNLDNQIPLLILVKNRIPQTLEFFTQRYNAFCALFSVNNKKHLICSLRRINSYIRAIRSKNREENLRIFVQSLFIWAMQNPKQEFYKKVRELLNQLSEFLGFQVVFALENDKNHRFNLYRNGETMFCPLLLSATSLKKICVDFLNGEALYLPMKFIKDDDFVFSATEESAQIMASMLKNTNTCGLCHIFDYRSVLFLPFKVNGNNWLLILCDKAPGKANEEFYKVIKEIIPAISSILSFFMAQFSLSRLLELYNSALSTGRIGVWEYDVETRKIISVGLQALFPYLRVPEELNEWWQYIHPEDRLNFWHAVKPCLKGLTNSFAVDHRLLLPGERVVWVRTIGECKEKREGGVTRLIGIGMDITSFMKKEEELIGLRENLKVASEIGNIGLWSWDISNNRYTFNTAGIKLFGLEHKSFYTFEDWLERIPKEYREEVQIEIGRTLAQGKEGTLNIEYEIRYENSIRKWIHTFGRISEYDSTGNPKVLSGTHIDITTRKLTEKHLMKEAIVSSRYASLARSLLRADDIEKISQLILSTTLDTTNSEIAFVGYDTEKGSLHITGMAKNREIVYDENWKLEEVTREFEVMGHSLNAGVPLIINDARGKEIRIFGNKLVERLLLIPTFTYDRKVLFVMDINAPEPYSPFHMESLEWLSSVFAQAYSRVKLEKANEQKTTELENTIRQLESALATVKRLHGLLPICARCKRIRDDAGYWHEVEVYIRQHSDAEFTHGICPKCAKELYGDLGNVS